MNLLTIHKCIKKKLCLVPILKCMLLKDFIYGLALFSSISIQAQSGFIDSLQKKFGQYRLDHLQEKIFVHSDKDFYLTGEILWFKVYNVDAAFHQPINISKVAYVEIINKEKKAVFQTKIVLNEGIGNGSIVLPSYLASDNYIFRAYNNWMKNFSAGFYFEKLITVVNPVRKPDWPVEDSTGAYEVRFFPEGGNLVYGIQSKLAFRVSDRSQKGIDCRGMLVNQKNDTIVSFTSLKFGMGQFSFTPLYGNTYKALIISDNGRAGEHYLPVIYNQGYVMRLSDSGKERLKITVDVGGTVPRNLVYLIVHSRNSIQKALIDEANNGVAGFVIDKNDLEEGISSFTIFNNERQPVCERLYFKRPSRKLDINVNSDQENYSLRKKINLDLQTRDNTGKTIQADLSVSVFLSDSLQTFQTADIESYLWLSSELKGKIEAPEYYFMDGDKVSDVAIDNLMLTHGWRRFKWEDIIQNENPSFEFVPEYAGHIITGRVTDKQSGKPAKGITAYLTVPGEKFHFSSSVSNPNGMVFFDVKKLYGTGNIIIQTNHLQDSVYRVDITSPYSDQFANTPTPPFDLPEKWKDQLLDRVSYFQVQNAYSNGKTQKFFLPDDADTSAFYGAEDKTYYLDDYTRFATMEEVMREYVTEVQIRKIRGEFHYRVSNNPYKTFFDDDPLILIDGAPVFNADKIITFDPLKIKKVDIITRKYYQGAKAFDGIVSYSTYQGDLGGFQLDPNSLILEYQGLQLQRQFYSPTYESPQEANYRIPDFRNLLYWSPDVKTDEKGKGSLSFYSSDLPGRYTVIVQGISENGLPGKAIASFAINK